MNTAESIDLLNDLEQRFPVEQWSYRGIELWPILRTNLGFSFMEGEVVIKSPPRRKQRHPWIEAITPRPHNISGFLKATLTDFNSIVSPDKRTEAVFFGDNISRIQIRGRYYDRFCDPIIDQYEKDGIRCEHIEPLRTFKRSPRFRPSILLSAHILDAIGKYYYQVPPSTRSSPFPSRDLAELFTVARAAAGDISFNAETARRIAETVAYNREIWLRYLSANQARVVYIVEYYNSYGWALCDACHELGIPTVELQHGRQDPQHHAYGRWNKCPSVGYRSLPHTFWSWSAFEQGTIEKWAAKLPKHRSFVGGNPYIESWKLRSTPLVSNYIAQARARIPQLSLCSKVVLATPSYQIDCVEQMLETIALSPKGWFWLLRLHPMETMEIGRLERSAADRGLSNVEIKLSTTFPLYCWLSLADAHFTGHSSTVIEARAFGLPSVAIQNHAARVFPEQMAEGSLHVSEDPLECSRLLDSSKRCSIESCAHNLAETLQQLHYQLNLRSFFPKP